MTARAGWLVPGPRGVQRSGSEAADERWTLCVVDPSVHSPGSGHTGPALVAATARPEPHVQRSARHSALAQPVYTAGSVHRTRWHLGHTQVVQSPTQVAEADADFTPDVARSCIVLT